jgi:hypothetical protein
VAAFGIGGALLAVTSAAHAKGLFGLSRGLLFRSGFIGTASVAAVWAGVELASGPESMASAPAPQTASAPAPAVHVTEEANAEVSAPPPARLAPAADSAPVERKAATVSNSRHSAASAESTGSLSEELAALDRAREAQSTGDPGRSLRLLDDYSRRFNRPRLVTEATVLRMEALVASGDRPRAAAIGRTFLANHANGPYERRVRSLLGDAVVPRKSR